MVWQVPAPDQQAPLTQAPTQSLSVAQLFRVHPLVPEQTKFVGQLVDVHALGPQWPVASVQAASPGGVEGQSPSLVHFAVQADPPHEPDTQMSPAPPSAQLRSVVHSVSDGTPPQTC